MNYRTVLLSGTFRRLAGVLILALALPLLPSVSLQAQTAGGVFVIEAEDFNYNSGQTLATASVMPYYGGAYAGLTATLNVDFQRTADGSSPVYRNDARIPMNDNLGDANRGPWSVTANYKMGWTGDGNWYNYTRNFPTNFYKVYASLSYGDTSPNTLRGSMQLVTSGANTTSQTLSQLGTFNADGSGGWGLNSLVPLRDANGNSVIVQLGGTQTIRFTAGSGDIDYYKFVVAGPPQIATHPASQSVMENRPVTFTVVPLGDDPVTYQWQSNLVNIAGATRSNLTFSPRLTASGSRFRCVLTNPLGSTNSLEATLTVTNDPTPPHIVKAFNQGATQIRLIFDEAVLPPGGPAASSFAVNNGISVSAVSPGSTNTDLLLTVSPLSFGTPYTVTLNNVTDLANTPNPIAPNTTVTFTASEYQPGDVGSPALPGSIVRLSSGAFDVTGGGSDIGGTSDQFQFAWELRNGDFDIQTRIAAVDLSDPYLHAGLMVRESLAANARFAAIFSSSAQLGAFFETRATAGAAATSSSLNGGFPANYPQMWLRFRRISTSLIGYASLDGRNWIQLGTTSLSGLPTQVYFGPAVCSGNASRLTTARFRDLGPTANPTVVTSFTPDREPLGPSSRRTGIVFSEIMYHPADRPDLKNLEFVELYNAGSIYEDLGGWRLSGDIDFTFPAGFRLEAGAFVVVAANPTDFLSVHSLTNVLGPYTNNLPNNTATLRLRNELDAIRLEVTYSDDPPWPAAADGAGHSLVLTRPSYGEADPRAWNASDLAGGSPGNLDAINGNPWQGVVLNEVLAHTDLPQVDFLELYNRSNTDVDLSGCILTDDPATNRYVLPNGTLLPARGFLGLTETQLGFRLSAAGETLFLISSNRTRVLDALRFGAQENGVASGRSPDGSPTVRRLSAPTLGAANAPWRVENLVINEIMFNPISGNDDDEYVELHNRSSTTIDLSGWKFTAGIDYELPAGTTLAPGGFLVVARNTTNLLARYPQLSAANTRGDFSGTLRNGGERLALTKPDLITSTNELELVTTNKIRIVVSEVTYAAGGRWGRWADGGGSSLELIDPDADLLRPSNWADSDESSKAPWTTVSFTGVLDNGNGDANYAANRLHLLLLGPGECLVDNVEIFRSGSTNLLANPGFESGATGWSFFGNHSTSSLQASGADSGTQCLRLRATGDGDTGINSVRAPLGATLAAGNTATLRARVRWIAGWPQILLRTRGNAIECAGDMTLPTHLGSPGLANSRRIANAGPALYDVTHTPPLPRANQAVIVTCRVSDPDGFPAPRLRFRVDPSTTLTDITMRDDGAGGDAIAGDGIYSATLGGRAAASLVAFRVEATDNSGASTLFPAQAPAQECLVRWGDPAPLGSFGHYHMWSTAATESARGNALNNTLRDATLVYGNHRVVYNIGFRDKGSPWHGGAGDFVAITPQDDQLLGATDRVFASTGNGGSEPTQLRSRMASWLARRLGVPALNAHYIQLYRNGGQHREVSEDLEQPNHDLAESWFPDAAAGDLYKIAMWFEFQDDNSTFSANSATIQRATTTGGAYKLARYRWMFQRRSNDGNANNFTNLFNLVTAINNYSGSTFTPANAATLLNQADIDQWMRVFAMGWIMGDWDMWSFNVGQNMYIYKPDGLRWSLIRWDIDFTFGLGSGPNERLWNGQDPSVNIVYDTPVFRRMLWQAYLDAANSILLPSAYQPPMSALNTILAKNSVPGLAAPDPIATFIDQRRAYILGQIAANNISTFAITSNGGNNFSVATPTVTLTGTAPFSSARIEVNGIPYPVTWTSQTAFQITIPLLQGANLLTLTGTDRNGNPVPGASDTITVTFTGVPQLAQDYLSINEVHYNPSQPNASFLEIHNRSTTTPFDLSNFRIEGIGYSFPEGALLQPNAYLLLVKDRAAFAAAYGATLPVFDEFPGSLDNGGEYLALIKPGVTPDLDLVISDLRYDNALPWSLAADGLGSSLQLVDPAQDEYRVGNWTTAPTNHVDRVTPGRANFGRQSLAAFPPLWINEVQPQNVTGPTDNTGEREPWIELHNSGTATLDLSAFYLASSYTNLTEWPFPAGTTLAPGQFLSLWADGEPAESAPGNLHTSFRLNPTNGSVALVRLQGTPSTPAVMDYLDYVQLAADRTFGSYPDGEPRRRRLLYYATPGATNNPSFPAFPLALNELMAANNTAVADPADGNFEDWFEIHNRGTTPVDLSSFTLTDNLTNSTQFRIPPGYVIPPGGFLLVWADNETGQNSPTNGHLHVNFQLAAAGEQLGLFSPDGSLIDSLTFGAQTPDVSVGRFPDSGTLPLLVMGSPTPGAPNVIGGANQPPVLATIGNRSITETTLLSFSVSATDPDAGQTLTYALAPGAPTGSGIDTASGQFTWIPTESQGPGSYPVTVVVSDNGSPVRTSTQQFTVSVLESNRPPLLVQPSNATLPEGSPWTLTLSVSDPDLPANTLSWSLGAGAPAGLTLDPATRSLSWTPGESQGPGSYPVTVTVNDNGSPALTDSKTFTLTVSEVNNPPTFDFIQAQTTDELIAWSVTARAVDPDAPPSSIQYGLDSAPVGAQINPATGLITWTPTEAQGPTNAIFTVRATELSAGSLSSTRSFSVAVNEVNLAPTLAQPANVTLTEGQTLDFTLNATDPDLPAQALTYAIVSGAPAGATLDPNSGRFLWVTGPDQGASSHTVTVRATDSAPAPLASARTFTITVRPAFHVVINEIMYRPPVANAEFIELHNNSAVTPEDLSGLRLAASGLSFSLPNGTILAPGAFLCVARDPAAFRTAYGSSLPVTGPWTGGSLATSDTIDLVRPGTAGQPDTLLDSVTYHALAPWPTQANGSGASLQLTDPLRDNNRVGNWLATAPFSGSSQLLTLTNLWRYWQSGPADATWRDLAYNDSTWPLGQALLFNETAALPAPKNTQLTLGQITYYFRTRFNLPSIPTAAALQLAHVLDDGMVVWLNGTELFRTNMPAGPVTHDTLASVAVADATLAPAVTLPGSALRTGDNLLAVEVHQSGAGSTDIVFGLALDLTGGTIAPYTPGATNNVLTTLPEFPNLRINEVLTRNATGLTDAAGEREPWIEIANPGSTPVSLDGLWLSSASTNLAQWAFPTGYAVPAGGFVLVFADGEPGETSLTEWHTSFRLPTTAGQNWTVILSRTLNTVVQPIDALWGTVGPDDSSIGRLPDGDPSSSDPLTPTPGAANSAGSTITITSVGLTPQGQPTFVWTAQPGRTYRVEYKNSLEALSWTSAGNVTASAATASFTDTTTSGVPHRFYRVVAP